MCSCITVRQDTLLVSLVSLWILFLERQSIINRFTSTQYQDVVVIVAFRIENSIYLVVRPHRYESMQQSNSFPSDMSALIGHLSCPFVFESCFHSYSYVHSGYVRFIREDADMHGNFFLY